ncbi:MAG TPA: hypothetical protein VJ742_13015 [Nitrososphaera sp.]|nr:hypothetical protein [Nitrososphaera sp.]
MITFSQFGCPELYCDFEDPLLQKELPEFVKTTVRTAFASPGISLVTISWFPEDGTTMHPTGTFGTEDSRLNYGNSTRVDAQTLLAANFDKVKEVIEASKG